MKKKIVFVLLTIFIIVTLVPSENIIKADTVNNSLENTSSNEKDKFKDKPTGLKKEDSNSKDWAKNNIEKVSNIDELNNILKDEESSNTYKSKTYKNSENSENNENESLPDSVDNSKSIYFPNIADQIGGSCTAYSSTYYQMTYAYNKLHNISSKDESNICSPNFVYNLANNGKDHGSSIAVNYKVLKEIGAATQKTVPIKVSNEDTYFTDYHGNIDAYKDASLHKIKDSYALNFADISLDTPITGPKDSHLNIIKYGLAHGEIYSIGTDIGKFIYSKISKNETVPENNKYVGEEIVSRCCDEYNGYHEMTIVGYDDNIWFDINKDNKVEEAEKGAFKIANSWGDNYCNNGFIWISYDALNKVSAVNNSKIDSKNRIPAFDYYEVYGFTVKNDNELSNTYLKIELNTKARNQVSVEVSNVDESNEKTFLYPLDGKSGGAFGFDGSEKNSNGTFMLDLSNYDENINYDYIVNNGIKITVSDICKDDNPLKVISASIVNTSDNKEIKLLSYTKKIDGDSIELYVKEPHVNKVTNLKLLNENGNVKVSYNAPSNSKDIKYYEIYRDDVLVAKTSDTSFVDSVNSQGTFNYRVRALDNYGEYSAFSKASISLDYKKSNLVKIYYKNDSFNRAFIHYKVGNNNWTSVPGKEMTPSKLKKGYFEYTIDIPYYDENTEVTVCFNNGNNVWDNNNSNNYVLNKGYYIIENGKLEETYPDLKAGNLTFDKDYPYEVGKPIKIYPNVSGGSSNYKYKYTFLGRDDNGSQIETSYETDKPYITYRLYYVAIYKITCLVTDTVTGDSVSLSADYKIIDKKIKITSVEFDKESPQPINSRIAMKINTSYVSDKLSYDVDIFKDGVKTSYMYSKHLDNNFIWDKDYSTGDYVIQIKVKDELTGSECFKRVEYTIKDEPLKINYFKALSGYSGNEEITTVKAGTDFRLESYVTGGDCDNGEYKYYYTCLYNGKKFDLKKYKSGYIYGKDVFQKPGKYTINFHVSDKSDNKASKKISIMVTQGDLNIEDSSLSNNTINYGDPINLQAKAKYALGNVYYKVVDQDINGTVTVIQDFSDNSNISWIPKTSGTHYITLYAKDSRNNITTSNYYCTVQCNNLITLYYKGFDTNSTYIHYKIGNNPWTNAPGVIMNEPSDIDGYAKITINLCNENNLTACFNNGSGTWDNNNTKNYYIEGAGTYFIYNNEIRDRV